MQFILKAMMAIGGLAVAVGVDKWFNLVQGYLDSLYPNLSDYVLIPLILSVIVIGIYYYVTSKKNLQDGDIKEICHKIHEELKDGIESLDGTLNRETQQHEINGKKINYKHIYMNRKVFDGYVNSGDFNQIQHELQQPLQDIYLKISIHDDLIKKIVDNEYIIEDISTLNQIEREMIKEIPSMMRSLKKYF